MTFDRQATLFPPMGTRPYLRAQREIRPLEHDAPYHHALLVQSDAPDVRPAERTRTWWYTDRSDLERAWCGRTLRPLAVLPYWRDVDPALPKRPAACAAALLALGQTLGIQLPMTPALLALRFFRRFLRAPWPPEPHAIALASFARRPGLFLYAARRGTWIRRAFRYDLNQAYTSYLCDWPEPGCGEWQPTRSVEPTGIYQVRFLGVQQWMSGAEMVELTSTDFGRVEIEYGWHFAHDDIQSSITEFCAYCSTYAGPLGHLVRRLPALLVGKLRSGWWADKQTWYGAACIRPTVYAAVVGSLWQRMYRTACYLGAALTYAFVDGIHSQSELPDHWIGLSPGTWKLEEESAIRYEGSFGRWRSANASRHQGVKSR